MKTVPEIETEIILFSPESGGRKSISQLKGFMPHLVIGSSHLKAKDEDYLGVVVIQPSSMINYSTPTRVRFGLMYYPKVDYSKLVVGVEFTIREGSSVIGSGKVLSAMAP